MKKWKKKQEEERGREGLVLLSVIDDKGYRDDGVVVDAKMERDMDMDVIVVHQNNG